MNYWKKCISIVADDIELDITEEQLDYLADAVASREQEELRELKQKIKQNEDWINSTKPCQRCTTTGSVFDGWGKAHTCPYCYGKGRVCLRE
jgi:hypothetical protein